MDFLLFFAITRTTLCTGLTGTVWKYSTPVQSICACLHLVESPSAQLVSRASLEVIQTDRYLNAANPHEFLPNLCCSVNRGKNMGNRLLCHVASTVCNGTSLHLQQGFSCRPTSMLPDVFHYSDSSLAAGGLAGR